MNKDEDPFERIKKIKLGQLDHQLPHYEELHAWIERCPMTWLPGLLIYVVRCGIKRGVFAEGGASKIAASTEEQERLGHSELREHDGKGGAV